MSEIQKLVVWASGRIDFIGGRDEPDGAILVCTAHGEDAIEALYDAVKDASVLHDFGSQVWLRVPNINPDRPWAGEAVDDAVEELIAWEDDIRSDLAPDYPEIEWTRA